MSIESARQSSAFFLARLEAEVARLRSLTYPGHHPGPGMWLDLVSGLVDTGKGYLTKAADPAVQDGDASLLVKDSEMIANHAYILLQKLDGTDADQIPHQIVGPFQRWVDGLGIGNTIFFRADHVANYELARFDLRALVNNVNDASQSLVDAAEATAIEGDIVSSPSEAPAAPVRVMPDAAGPSVTVMIFCNGDASQRWSWQTVVPGGTARGTGTISLDSSHRMFAESLLRACPDMKPESFRRTMRGVGEQLWRAAPSEFRDAYVTWRGLLGSNFPIQFVTEDPHIPWEMMRPDVNGLGADHLFFNHPTSRWPLSRAPLMRNSIPQGDVLSFVPDYNGPKALPSAKIEGAWVVSALGAQQMEAKATRGVTSHIVDNRSGDSRGDGLRKCTEDCLIRKPDEVS